MFWWNLLGLGLIVLIVWWFWGWRSKGAVAIEDHVIDIVVDNGVYDPEVISAKLGSTVTLRFFRKDQTPCSSTVIFDEFGVSADLPVNEKKDVVLMLERVGEFEFTCQMGMYRGRLMVTE